MAISSLRHWALRLLVLGCGLGVFAAHSQTTQQEPLPGPDSHETGQGPHGHLFGDWGGERTRLARARGELRFSIRQRFSLESQERAEGAICKLEQIPRNGGHRFWGADRSAGIVFPCNRALAGRRQSRSLSRAADKSQRHVQREYMPSRFMVDREAMAGSNESLHASVSSRVRISTEPSTTRRPLSSSRWAMRWAIYSRLSSPSILPRPRRWRSASYRSTTFM